MARNAASSALTKESNRIGWNWTAEAFGSDGAGTSIWFGVPEVAFKLSSMDKTVKLISL